MTCSHVPRYYTGQCDCHKPVIYTQAHNTAEYEVIVVDVVWKILEDRAFLTYRE